MMFSFLFKEIVWKKRAGLLAVLWTLLIFLLCLLPGNEIPDISIPLMDKWAHFILFAIWAFLWLVAMPVFHNWQLIAISAAAVALGWLTEFIQGQLVFLQRNQDNMDVLADAIGGIIGTLIFYILYLCYGRKDRYQ